MEIYLVGGAVRDRLLDLPVEERDWVVVGATPEEMIRLGYRPVGKDFPVFLHPETKEEYALARTERKSGRGYKGFQVHASPDVTLEQDLQRRDLTINAMAETPDGRIIDPYGGQQDLEQGLLRHVSPAFAEDPVRILRVARFAARLSRWGFHVAHGTNALMRKMVNEGEVDYLVPERVWAELVKALQSERPAQFFKVLHGCGALAVLFPEIERAFQHVQPHDETADDYTPLAALEAAVAQSEDVRVRFAILLHALGPQLTPAQRLAQAQALCKRYRVPGEYATLASDAIQLEEHADSSEPEHVLKLMESAGAFKQTQRWPLLLQVYQATGLVDQAHCDRLRQASQAAAGVNAAQLQDPDLRGPALGAAIRTRRLEVVQQAMSTNPSSR